MAHTPGPWLFFPSKPAAGHIVTSIANPILYVEATTEQGGADFDANVALSIAAPDLLAALQAILAPWKGLSEDELQQCDALDNVELARLLAARAAVAKATTP